MGDSNLSFIGIGAQKAGTSWLFKQFEKSNQIELPPIKELHYFDRGKNYPSRNHKSESKLYKRLFNLKWTRSAIRTLQNNKSDREWYKNWFFSEYNDKWYLSLFKDYTKTTGEITPAYAILNENDVYRMSKLLGSKTKIIFMLRHPVERSWSSFKYRFKRNEKLFEDHDFAKKYFLSEEHLVRCDYVRTINLYKKYFDSVFIGFFDAIVENPELLLQNIFEYLELDIEEINTFSGLTERVNTSKSIRMPNELRSFLEEMHKEKIVLLSSLYGEYFKKWENPTSYPEKKYFSPSLVVS